MRSAQARLLAYLADLPPGSGATFASAADALGYRAPSALHRLLASLADQGLVERAGHLDQCRPTVAGYAALGRAQPEGGVPIVGAIAAGSPILAEGNRVGALPDLAPRPGRFALKVRGDSMIGAGIHDGDFAIIDVDRPVRDGDIGAVAIGDEATLKRVYYSNQGVSLVAENPAYAPMELAAGDETWRVLGGLVLVVRPM